MGEYFGRDVDANIKLFCAEQDIEKKNEIFTKNIRPALMKLIESQMYVYKFNRLDDTGMLKNDCLSTLYELLPKFDPTKGKKAFSYFNVVVKNWFIWKIRESNKQSRTESVKVVDAINSADVAQHGQKFIAASYEDELIEKEFFLSLYRDMERWKTIVVKKTEKQVLEAVIFLLQNPRMISIYNKKAIQLYIREITGLNAKQVIANLKRLRELYEEFKERFNDGAEKTEEDLDEDDG